MYTAVLYIMGNSVLSLEVNEDDICMYIEANEI